MTPSLFVYDRKKGKKLRKIEKEVKLEIVENGAQCEFFKKV